MDERLKLMMWLNTVVYAAYAVSGAFLLPSWESLFASFDVPLSAGARFLFLVYPWLFVIPVILVSGIYFFNRRPPAATVTAVWKAMNIVLFGLALLIPPAVIYVLYPAVANVSSVG